jgi:hypothetical protein
MQSAIWRHCSMDERSECLVAAFPCSLERGKKLRGSSAGIQKHSITIMKHGCRLGIRVGSVRAGAALVDEGHGFGPRHIAHLQPVRAAQRRRPLSWSAAPKRPVRLRPTQVTAAWRPCRSLNRSSSLLESGRQVGCGYRPSWANKRHRRTHSSYNPNSRSAFPCAMRSLSAALTGNCSKKTRPSTMD